MASLFSDDSTESNLPIATLVTPMGSFANLEQVQVQELVDYLNTSGFDTGLIDRLIEGGCDSIQAFAHITDKDLSDLNLTSMKRKQIIRRVDSVRVMQQSLSREPIVPPTPSPSFIPGESKMSDNIRRPSASFRTISDHYDSLAALQQDLRKGGLESSDLIIGIDLTKSNTWQGERTFNDGKCKKNSTNLHRLNDDVMNPYEHVISALGRCLEEFDDDNMIPVFGFGDVRSKEKTIVTIGNGKNHGFEEVLLNYRACIESCKLSGGTTFHPLIDTARRIAKAEESYHILVIICDGHIDKNKNKQKTMDAIVAASEDAPLSIICVGVGDGPWEDMLEFDDLLPERTFDNFQFVEFATTWVGDTQDERDANFALHCLMEIPDQYLYLKDSEAHGIA